MRITNIGSDYIKIDENNIEDKDQMRTPKVHLIKLDFFKPTENRVKKVLEKYPQTNRFIISDNIKVYNYILKKTSKKYYVENAVGSKIITFFKKNNKVLLNFNNLTSYEKAFLLIDECFDDVLRNTEVICISQDIFEMKKTALSNWSGNVIIDNVCNPLL